MYDTKFKCNKCETNFSEQVIPSNYEDIKCPNCNSQDLTILPKVV